MADRKHSHPQAPMYGPKGGPGSTSLDDVQQYESALAIGWSQLTSVPTTISGYGITDAYTKTEVDALLDDKADVGDSYTKAEADALLADKAGSATTLAGYGITDSYTKTAADALLALKASLASPAFTGTATFDKLTSSGIAGLAGSTNASVAFFVGGNAANYPTTGTTQYGMAVNGRFGSACTVEAKAIEFQANLASEGASYTIPDVTHLSIRSADLGTNAHITNQYGIRILDLVEAGVTNTWAIKTGTGLVSFGDQLQLSASTTARSTLRIPHGAAPTSPVNGDMWTTSAGLYVRINGATVGPLS